MENLKDLQLSLPKTSTNLRTLMPAMQLYQGIDWQSLCKFSKQKYNRIKLFNNDIFELYLICWSPQQESPIHDHPKQGCIMKVLSGTLQEQRFSLNNINLISTKNLPKGNIAYIDNHTAYHKINNLSDNNAVSLHLYSPPNHVPQTLESKAKVLDSLK